MSNAKSYVGVAPLTMIRTEAGGYGNVYAGDPVPTDIKGDDLKRLVDEGFLAEIKDEGPKPGTADFILAEVGDDKEKAAAAIKEEEAGQNRSTLLTKLKKIAEG